MPGTRSKPTCLQKEMCTPMRRWMAEHSMQRYTPNVTDVQLGFFAGQSKQTCDPEVLFSAGACRHASRDPLRYLVSCLRFQLSKHLADILRRKRVGTLRCISL